MAEPPLYPPPPPPQWAPPGDAPGPPPGVYASPRTEPFAIVSLVASLASPFVCGIGTIVAIVFGHIARSRIKRSGDSGGGMALAGLIIGYIEVVIAAAAVVVFILVVVNTNDDAMQSAQRLAQHITVVADRTNGTPRDGDVVRRAIREAGFSDDRVLVGSTDQYAITATNDQLAGEGWRLEVRRGLSGRVCLTVPETTIGLADITHGSCPSGGFSG